jgi:hypothetical protein
MPAAGLSPLRVAPEDVGADEAGELVKDLGVHNQAKGLLQAVARQMPKDLRVAMQREEHRQRSKFLDPDEVRERALEAVGEVGDRGAVQNILGARVRAAKGNAFDGMVIIQYETPSGRTARCAVLHNANTFPKSVAAYDQAQREGKIELPGELSDAGSLRKALEDARAENARLAREVHAGASGEHDDDLRHDRIPGEDPEAPPVPEENLVELPEGVAPGDPGYPVDEETGELLVMPQSVRDSLIVAHERDVAAAQQVQEAEEARAAAEAKAKEAEQYAEELAAAPQPAEAETGAVWPESLDEVELPEGNADTLKAGLPYYSTVVVAALAERARADSVKAAAAAELETRPDKPAEESDPS